MPSFARTFLSKFSSTWVTPYIPAASSDSEKNITTTFVAGNAKNLPKYSIIRFDVCGRGSSQAGLPSFGRGARQKGRKSLRPDLILLTSYVIMATKNVTIIRNDDVTVSAA